MHLKKALYTLAEAAELLRCEADELLKHGSTTALSLYVRVPNNVDLYNVGRSDLRAQEKPWELSDRPQPTRTYDIDFLKLEQIDCLQLLSAGMALPRIFKAGGRLGADGNLQCKSAPCPPYYDGPLAAYRGSDHIWRYFATYQRGTLPSDWIALAAPMSIDVNPETLLLTRVELLALQDRKTIVPDEVLGQVELNARPHISPKLRQLHELHCTIWGRAHLSDFKPPNKDEIAARLVQEYKFSNNLAECGALILHATTLEADARSGKPRLDASLLKALIRCADVHWSANAERPAPNPSNDDVGRWLVDNCGFPAHRGKAAASLIRPSTAPLGRKRNEI